MYEIVIKGVQKSFKNNRKVIQKLVDLDHLNVIGENHLDSRVVEKNYLDYLYRHKKYGYWTETSFPERHGQSQLEGDPTFLRFLFMIAAVSEQAVELKEKVEAGTSVDSLSMDYLNGCINIEKLQTQIRDPQNSLNKYLKYFPINEKDLLAKMRSVKMDMDKFPCVSYCYNQNTEKKGGMSGLLDHMIGECSIIRGQLQIRENKDTYRRIRSDHMHLAANEKKDLSGVWKVGDRHREDMEKINGREYNLISREEFYSSIYHNDPSKQMAAERKGVQKLAGRTGMKQHAALILNHKLK